MIKNPKKSLKVRFRWGIKMSRTILRSKKWSKKWADSNVKGIKQGMPELCSFNSNKMYKSLQNLETEKRTKKAIRKNEWSKIYEKII